MTKISLKKGLKQVLIVLGLSSLLLIAFAAISGIVGAQGMIGPGDQPAVLAGQTGGEGSLRQIVLNIVNFILIFLGLIAVIMIIYGGITYVTSAGNNEAIEKAKKIIMYAIIGIVVVLVSFALVNTILGGAGVGQETT
jgi:hypothetical protein